MEMVETTPDSLIHLYSTIYVQEPLLSLPEEISFKQACME